MSSTTSRDGPQTDMESFSRHLQSSKRILALLGAGLSASSGLPTFRGAGGLWRRYDAMSLATPGAFDRDPALVWQFYSYRRHMALNVQPNRAHLALAELAKRNPGFMTLSQNVDGLSQRAGHPAETLQLLHGSLFDVRCTNFYCNYQGQNFDDPIVDALKIPTEVETTSNEARELDIANEDVELPRIPLSELPTCPKCKEHLLRPGVVWFGEMLPGKVLDDVEHFIEASPKIDLMLVIGTSAVVTPAAGYVDMARAKQARVAVVNMDAGDMPAGGLGKEDWFFEGDAARIVPEMLKSVVGEITQPDHKP